MKKLPIQIKIVIAILIIMALYKGVSSIVIPTTELYNEATELRFSYQQTDEKQITNFDSYYLAFIDKKENANISRETFIELTSIIMSNRKDGANLAWKWNQENQNIPFNEFTSFYKELSSFISERYADNRAIEIEKQLIVKKHNTLLSTFPNNQYNKFLKIKPLVYKKGYISAETKAKFKNK